MKISRRVALKRAIECVTKCTNEAHHKWRLYGEGNLKTPEEKAKLEFKYVELAATLQFLEAAANQEGMEFL